MPSPRSIGAIHEDQAARFLLGNGYTILTRRYRCRGGELDIVALEGETIVFVEVKARSGRFPPEQAVTSKKRDRVLLASRHYLEQYDGPEREVRYDLVAIDSAGTRLFKGAFEPE